MSDEDDRIRSVAIQNKLSILLARQRAEEALVQAKEALERKTDELAHSLALVRATLEATTNGILVTNERREVTDFNEQFMKLWDIPRELLESHDHRKLAAHISRHFSDPKAFLTRIDEIYTSWPEESYDLLRTADDRVVERHSRMQVVAGRNVGRVWTFRDLTERVRAQEGWQLSQRRLAIAMGAGQMGDWDRDLATGRVTWSPALEALHGLPPGAFGGTMEEFEQRIHSDDRRRVREIIQNGIEAKTDYRVEYRILKPGGAIAWIEARGTVLCDAGGRPQRTMGVCIDITARKNADAALRASEEFNRTIVESSLDCIKTLSLEGDLLWISRNGQRQICIEDASQVIGHSWIDFWQGDDRDAARGAVAAAAAGGTGHFVGRFPVRGEDRWFDVLVTPILGDAGKPEQLLAVSRDVTERRRAERAQREIADRLKLALSAGQLSDWTWNAQTDCVTFGRRGAQFFGISPDTPITRRDLLALVHENDREYARAAVKKAVESRADYNIEFRVRRPSGELRWIAARGRGIHAEDGALTGMTGVVQDITDRKEADEALRQSETRLTMAMEAGQMGGWEWTIPTGKVTWSPTLETIHGLPLGTFGGTFDDFQRDIHPEDRERVVSTVRDTVERRSDYRVEYRILRPDGKLAWVEARGKLFFDANGECERMVGVCMDITARKQIEEALLEEARILELLNATGNALASNLDLETVVQSVTDASTALSGAKFGAFFYNVTKENGDAYMLYTLSGAPREAFAKFGNPRATALFGPTFRGEGTIRSSDILKDPRYGTMEPHRGMPAGHLPVRSYLAVPVISRSGEVLGGLFFGHPEPGVFTERSERIVSGLAAQAAIAIDNARLYDAAQQEIGQRKRVEHALRESRDRLRFMAESMPQKIFTAKPDGEIDYFNGQWMEYAGLSFDEIRDWGWAQLVHPDDIEENLACWRQCLASGEPFQFEQRFRRADGTYRWHLSRAHPMRDADGRIIMWVGSNTDIDDIKSAAEERERLFESEQAARAQAERMSAMKDEFLATLSHELRTPLSAILGWSQVLIRRTAAQAEFQQGLRTIERNARMQTQLIEDLLDMSRITSGKVRLDIQPVEPVSFIEAAIETVRPAADAKGIRIEKILDSTAGPVSGDPGRLQQVIWNLLTNAVKFTPRDGKIQVVLERVNSHIEISVADTGIGIKPEFLGHVFERFRQADASTTRRHGGLGLGLSIVKQLVELHGGSVKVASDGENLGATFSVHLPVSVIHRFVDPAMQRFHPRAMETDSIDFTHSDLSGLKVLVVDDEPDARELIKRVLSECDAKVFDAGAAAEALELAQRECPDVLVSDIGMPGMDGYELLRRLRAQDHAAARIPAIALTAYARSEDRTRALRAGFLVHVSKPVEPSELVATVASVAGRTSRQNAES